MNLPVMLTSILLMVDCVSDAHLYSSNGLLPCLTKSSSTMQNAKSSARYIGSIHVEGAKKFTSDEIRKISRLRPKQKLKPASIEEAQDRIEKAYLKFGYIKRAVSVKEEPLPAPNKPGTDVVDIKISINEGESFYIRKIEVYGNDETYLGRILRATDLRPDIPYNPTDIEKWIKGLNRMNKFVTVKKEDIKLELNDVEHFVDLRIYLKELKK